MKNDICKEIVNQAPNGILVTDLKGSIIFLNEAAARITGVPASEAIGKHIKNVLPKLGLMNVLSGNPDKMVQSVRICGKDIIINQTRIYINGQLVGG